MFNFEIWPTMPFGAQGSSGPAWHSCHGLPLDVVCAKVAAAGYDGIDLVYDDVIGRTEAERVDPAVIPEIAARHQLGLGYLACHSTLVSPVAAAREAGLARLREGVDVAATLGIGTVCTLAGDGYYDPGLSALLSRSEAWRQCASGLSDACSHALERDVNISLELLGGSLINRIEVLERMLSAVDAPNLRVTVDLAAFYLCVQPFEPVRDAIRRLAERIDVVHLKDVVGPYCTGRPNFTWFGGGIVNFREVSQALADIHFDGIASVEWEGWFAGGGLGAGEPGGTPLVDFDRVALEAIEYLSEYDLVDRSRLGGATPISRQQRA